MVKKNETAYFVDISGQDESGKPKAHVALNFSLRFNDGSSIEEQELVIPQKPVVSVFKHAGFVNVHLDFLTHLDNDLNLAWKLLTDYSDPENSVDWTEEELESGYYMGVDDKEHMIYFPMLELVLSPIDKETEYIMHGLNPAFFTLQPNDPKGSPCVLQFVFPEEWFFINDEIDPINESALHEELEAEFDEGLYGPGYPNRR